MENATIIESEVRSADVQFKTKTKLPTMNGLTTSMQSVAIN